MSDGCVCKKFSMDSLSRLPFIFVFLMVYCVSCTKSTTSTSNSNGTTIYIVGSNGKNPVLWKNGSMQILSSTGGSASQVQVYNNTIYIGGISGQSTSGLFNPGGPGGESVYWINGIQNIISLSLNPGYTSFAISGNHFYYTNRYNLYENGSVISLPGKSTGYITCVLAVGSDIYVAGSDSVGDAVYWKNQTMHVVEQGYYPTHSSGSDPSVYCLFVSGTDVYMGGINAGDSATYWKNGLAIQVFGSDAANYLANINSLFVSGGDLYFTGNLIVPANGGTNAPAYWKNGVEHVLPLNGAAYGNATSILVSGTDVYVTGQTSEGAVYWKNGVEIILSSAGTANAIYVQ
jgi:hypothetical protein